LPKLGDSEASVEGDEPLPLKRRIVSIKDTVKDMLWITFVQMSFIVGSY